MTNAQNFAGGLAALSLLTSLDTFAAERADAGTPLALWVDTCLAESRASIEQVVSIELGRSVSLALYSPGATREEHATIECGAAGLLLRYVSDAGQRQRSLDVRGVSDKALARTVALAVVELIEAPETVKPRTAEADLKTVKPTSTPPAHKPTATRASVLGTARVFPATSDLTFGARLRSRFPTGQRSALLLGFGGERGSAARAPGDVSITAAYAELGLGYDLLQLGWFTLAVDALGEAGYVILKGQPRVATDTEGGQLRGAWSDLMLSLAPRFRLAAKLELTFRAGVGIMLLAPSATFNSQHLDVWRGVSTSADLGLALSL